MLPAAKENTANSHQGHQLSAAASHQPFNPAIPLTLIGISSPGYDSRGGSLSSTYFRDSETGLDYARNRYHSPGQGRFLTADPYMASGGTRNPGSWNRYSYSMSDPVNFNDPAGLQCRWVEVPRQDPIWVCDPPPEPTDCNIEWWRAECGGVDPAGGGLPGGGGDPDPFPQPPPDVPYKIIGGTDYQQSVLKGAFQNAMWKLTNPNDSKCWNFFKGSTGYAALSNITYRIVNFGPGREKEGAAHTDGEVLINSTGVLFNQVVNGRLEDMNTGLVGGRWGALLLLHELGHRVNVLRSPDSGLGAQPNANRDNTQDVLDHCFNKLPNGNYI